jgi:hypothetical protein
VRFGGQFRMLVGDDDQRRILRRGLMQAYPFRGVIAGALVEPCRRIAE